MIFKMIVLAVLSLLSISQTHAADCISFLPAGRNLHFWDDMESEVQLEAKRLGMTIYTKGTNTELQENQQIQLYKDLKKFSCDGLIIAPNSKEIQEYIEKDNFYKYVYLVDRSMSDKSKFTLVATDNYEAGAKAGRTLAKILNGKGKIILFRLQENISSTKQREEGFLNEIKKTEIKVIHDEYIGLDQGEARNKIFKILKSNIGKFDGAFTSNELLSNALISNLKMLKSNGQAAYKDAHFLVFDTNQNIEDALAEGLIDVIVAQNPKKMGREAVKLVKKSYDKKKYYKFEIDTGTYLLRKPE